MEKVKTATLANVLRRSVTIMKEQEEKLAAFERRERVDHIISKMAEKGIQTELSSEDLREDLMKKAEAGRLDAVEEAVEMSAGFGTVKIASMESSGTHRASDASGAELDSFVLTGDLSGS